MNIKKITFRTFAVIVLLFLFGLAYVAVTINRKPPIAIEPIVDESKIFIVPDAIATVSNNIAELDEIEDKLKVNLGDVDKISTQITVSEDNKSQQNKVVSFSSKNSKEQTEKQFEARIDLDQKERNGVKFYESKQSATIYYFPNDETLVITQDENIIQANLEEEQNKTGSNFSSQDGINFFFKKDDASLEHFTSNLPHLLVDRFQGINGSFNENGEKTSFVEIKMESAFYARALEMALPQVIDQLKSKIIKVEGKFVVSGENVTLNESEMEMIENVHEKVDIKSGGKSVYLIMNDEQDASYVLKMIRNVILNK